MSINSYQAGIYLRLMISSIWPSFNSLPNNIPASQGTTSIDFLCFFLYTLVYPFYSHTRRSKLCSPRFSLLQFPFILIHPSKLRPLFIFKSVTIPLTAVAMFIWACAMAGSDLSELMEEAMYVF